VLERLLERDAPFTVFLEATAKLWLPTMPLDRTARLAQ
jgi:hypothetical protein